MAGQKDIRTTRQVKVTEDAVAHTLSHQHPHDWPGNGGNGQSEGVNVTTSDWDRTANQSLDPAAKNPRRTRQQRESYSGSGGGV